MRKVSGASTRSNAERAAAATAAGFVVRPVTAADVTRTAEVKVQVWREAYAGLMPADYLAALDPAEFAAQHLARVQEPPPEVVDLVGLDPGGQIVGMGVAGPGVDDDRPCRWQLFAINVLRSARGTGLADLMMAELVGSRAVYLWVLPGNERARACYTRYGFVTDGGSMPFPPADQNAIRMSRPDQA